MIKKNTNADILLLLLIIPYVIIAWALCDALLDNISSDQRTLSVLGIFISVGIVGVVFAILIERIIKLFQHKQREYTNINSTNNVSPLSNTVTYDDYKIPFNITNRIDESITVKEEKRVVNHIAYEGRISNADKKRLKALLGYKCSACGKNMAQIYGNIGQHFIELHHKIPYSEIKENEERTLTDKEFCVLCPDCHRMIHKLPDASDIDL